MSSASMTCIAKAFPYVQDRISLGFSQASRTTNGVRNEVPIPLDEQLDSNDDRDLTSYRFKSRSGVNINITPLILPAAIQFEADMEKNVSNHDSLIHVYIILPMCYSLLAQSCVLTL